MSELESDAFVRWDFEIDEDQENLSFTYTWDYTALIVGQLEELDETDFAALNEWLDENATILDALFEIHHDYVDTEGERLDYETQVSELSITSFVIWDFEISGENLTFMQTWNYGVATSRTAATREDLIGSWERTAGDTTVLRGPFGNAMSTLHLVFLEDETTQHTGRDGDEDTSTWELTTDGILSVGASEFTAEMSMDGRLLVITDDRGREGFFEARGGRQYLEESDIVDSELRNELIGSWERTGSGAVLRGVFGNATSTLYVEFFTNGTTRHISRDSDEAVSIWELTTDGRLLVGAYEFTIETSMGGRLLTITDDRGREGTYEAIEELPTASEPESDDDGDSDDEPSASSSSSSSTSDWQQFLEDYDAFMDRFLRNPGDIDLFMESLEWTERTMEIQNMLDGQDFWDFTEEALRIAGRALE